MEGLGVTRNTNPDISLSPQPLERVTRRVVYRVVKVGSFVWKVGRYRGDLGLVNVNGLSLYTCRNRVLFRADTFLIPACFTCQLGSQLVNDNKEDTHSSPQRNLAELGMDPRRELP